MAYRYQNSYFEQERAEEKFSDNSMGHMGNNGCHNNQYGFGSGMVYHQKAGYSNNQHGYQHGFGNGMGHQQIAGYSNYGCPDSGYGMSNHHGHGYNNLNLQAVLGKVSSYAMNEESRCYSVHNSYYPHKSFF